MSQPEPLSVLFVVPGASQGNTMIFAKRHAEALSRAGVNIEPLFLPVGLSLATQLRNGRSLWKKLQARRYDIVHANYGSTTGFLCACLKRDPLLITYRGSDVLPIGGVPRVKLALAHFLSQLAALRANQIVCVSGRVREQLWWGGKGAEVIPSPVDLTLFRPAPRDQARVALGWNERSRVLLFVAGSNATGKGLPLVKAAIPLLTERLPDFELKIIQGGVKPHEMVHLYNAADCLVLASDTEGSPNVVKEALACNLPVVSVDVGDVPIRLSGVSPSFVVERSPHALAAAVIEVLESGQRSNGRERCSAFSQEEIVARSLSLYARVAGRALPV